MKKSLIPPPIVPAPEHLLDIRVPLATIWFNFERIAAGERQHHRRLDCDFLRRRFHAYLVELAEAERARAGKGKV